MENDCVTDLKKITFFLFPFHFGMFVIHANFKWWQPYWIIKTHFAGTCMFGENPRQEEHTQKNTQWFKN